MEPEGFSGLGRRVFPRGGDERFRPGRGALGRRARLSRCVGSVARRESAGAAGAHRGAERRPERAGGRSARQRRCRLAVRRAADVGPCQSSSMRCGRRATGAMAISAIWPLSSKRWLRSAASAIGLNPLHALFPDRAEDASPYSPSSRQFLNPLYIDLNAVDEFPGLAALGLEAQVSALRAADMVPYAGVAHAKIAALRACYARLRDAPDARRRDFEDFQSEQGEDLVRFAAFEVLRQRFGGSAWREWPEAVAAARQGADRPIVRRTCRRDRLSYVRAMARRQPVAGMPATGAPPGHAGRALHRSRGRRRSGRRRRLDRARRHALRRVGRRAAGSSTIPPVRTGD